MELLKNINEPLQRKIGEYIHSVLKIVSVKTK
jgi:hypothetical protein